MSSNYVDLLSEQTILRINVIYRMANLEACTLEELRSIS